MKRVSSAFDENAKIVFDENRESGSLTLVFSEMFGGKTSYTMRLIETIGYALRCLYINHTYDTRSEHSFSTHNTMLDVSHINTKLNADMIKVSTLEQIPDDIFSKYKVVFIDEAQFFPDLNSRVRHIVDNLKIEVHVTGLNGDFKRELFGEAYKLIPFADKIITLRDTLCASCASIGKRTPAIFTKNLEGVSGDQVQVGGADKYIPVCRKCYLSDDV